MNREEQRAYSELTHAKLGILGALASLSRSGKAYGRERRRLKWALRIVTGASRSVLFEKTDSQWRQG